jgi:hypothetical protein
MGEGWYVSRAGQVFGPYTWERALELAREGSIGADDMVMRPGSSEWARADSVPAFFGPAALAAADPAAPAAPAAPTAPAPATVSAAPPAPSAPVVPESSASAAESVIITAPAAPAADPATRDASESDAATPKRRKRPRVRARTVFLILGISVLVLAVGAAAVVWGPGIMRPKGHSTPPKAGNAIEVDGFGSVQRNRLVVELAEGGVRSDADQLAIQLKGEIVGEWDHLGLYTIEFPSTSADELGAALKTASEAKGIASAQPDRVPEP